jgi:hypothetical protein
MMVQAELEARRAAREELQRAAAAVPLAALAVGREAAEAGPEG